MQNLQAIHTLLSATTDKAVAYHLKRAFAAAAREVLRGTKLPGAPVTFRFNSKSYPQTVVDPLTKEKFTISEGVFDALTTGRKVQAIIQYRKAYGADLQTCKRSVDMWMVLANFVLPPL